MEINVSQQASSAPKPLEIQVLKPVLLSGPVLKFIPALADALGGELQAIVFHQLVYLSRELTVDGNWVKGKRLSLTRLQKQLPFVSRRWLIKIVDDLESFGAISASRSGRVNVYIPIYGVNDLVTAVVEVSPQVISSNYIVIPTLAKAIGLKAAIVLQQIHLRIYKEEGSIYFIRSLDKWHSETFPFWGIATVKRIFVALRNFNLIVIKKYRREDDGVVYSYRINYVGLAELLALPIPHVENPFNSIPKDSWDKDWQNWTNPVTLQMQSAFQ